MNKMITAEFYENETDPDTLIGAVDVPMKRMADSVTCLGKLICRIRRLNAVDALLLDEHGNNLDRVVIFR